MSTACDLLREARKQHHLTLEDVADATLINIEFLRAIERGSLDVLPQPYVRAFMREYAAVVGLDPVLLMEKLDREQAVAAPAEGAPAEVPPAGRIDAPSGPRAVPGAAGTAGSRAPEAPRLGTEGPSPSQAEAPNPEGTSPEGGGGEAPRGQASSSGSEEGAPRDVSRYAAPAVVIVILAIGAVILWNILGRKEPVVSERPFHEVIRENERLANPESTALQAPTPPGSSAAASAGDSLTLVAQASDSVWVRMMRDDGL
ncbi:MAG TPA: helix-turn-helix domain-containing protein, partial [Bacteroidota bacterium]